MTAASSATVPPLSTFASALELSQCFLRLDDKLGVIDERSVVDEILEFGHQYGTGFGIGRCTADFRKELRQQSAQILDRVLDRFCADVILRCRGLRPDVSRAAGQ